MYFLYRRRCLLVFGICIWLSVSCIYKHSILNPEPNEAHAERSIQSLMFGTKLLQPSSRICLTDDPTLQFKLLLLIPSVPDHRHVRRVIRNTWLRGHGNGGLHNKQVRHAFLVGLSPTWSLRRLREENNHHGDLVILDHRDTYRNLTRKTLLGLDWASKLCPQAQYIMKVDEDTFVNMTNILNILTTENYPNTKSMIGSLNVRKSPVRSNGHKWYVSQREYSGRTFPSYCVGSSYVMPTSVAKDIVGVASRGLVAPVIHLEDVFLGMCVQYLGYGLIHREDLNVDKNTALSSGVFCSATVATIHSVNVENLAYIWNKCSQNQSHPGSYDATVIDV